MPARDLTLSETLTRHHGVATLDPVADGYLLHLWPAARLTDAADEEPHSAGS